MGRIPIRLPSWRFIWRDGGQSLVLVALSFSVLMAGGAMGIDVGRFYAERRFIQDAVDSAALACARDKTRGGTSATAWAAADNIFQNRLLLKNPLGSGIIFVDGNGTVETTGYPARGSETYDNNVVADLNLNSGILPTTLGCRVAVTVRVPTYLLKVVTPSLNTIQMTTRAYAKAKGGLLPSVVKRYLNMGDTDNLLDGDPNEFVDTTATQATDALCHAGSDYAPGCVAASTATPGREIVLFGASQRADNDSSFRGYIGLDVRDFSTASPPNSANLLHTSYNGVAPTATVNTLKDFEGAWIGEGYPGPDICVSNATEFLPCAQIAVIDGSSSGIFVNWYQQYFKIGDIGLFQLYDGQVKSVPDFSFTSPTLAVPTGTSQTVGSKTVAFSMSTQFASTTSQVCSEIIPDNGTLTHGPGDTTGSNPFMTGAIATTDVGGTCTGTAHGNFSANPTTVNVTSYSQTLSGMTSTGATKGIYQAFIRGTASAPYDTRIHSNLMQVNVGGQVTEYLVNSSTVQQSVAAAALPATVDYAQVLGANNSSAKWNEPSGDSPITVSWESCPRSSDGLTQLVCYIGTVGTTSVTGHVGNTVNVTVSTAGALTHNTYTGWVRFVGTDSHGDKVVKLNQVILDVDQNTGGTTQYIDVIGYAAYQITAMDSNDVYGKAVTGAYLDPNDPALAIAKKIILVPWETNP